MLLHFRNKIKKEQHLTDRRELKTSQQLIVQHYWHQILIIIYSLSGLSESIIQEYLQWTVI